MNKEEIKAMIKDCVYSEDGITYMSDKQYNNCINIIEQLQQENQSLEKENKILRENAEHNDKVVDKFNWENQKLKKQVDYLRRSIERKEETITELDHDRVPYTNEYVEELKKKLDEYKKLNNLGDDDCE